MNSNVQPTAARLVPADKLGAISSLISEGAVFDGSFQTSRDLGLKVDGVLNGSIRFETGGTVHVGATGVIDKTTIEADYVFIEGKVIGKIVARKAIEIAGSATVLGDVSYDAMIDVHPRARIRGQVEYRGDLDSPVAG